MVTIPMLRTALEQALLQFYPAGVARALAAMHAQLHFEFANSLRGIEHVLETDPQETRKQLRVQVFNRKGKRLTDAVVRREIDDYLQSMPRPVYPKDLCIRFRKYGVNDRRTMTILQSLIAEERVLKVGDPRYPCYMHADNSTPVTQEQVDEAIERSREPDTIRED